MLIYNFQKEFVGIDEKDLKTLGFANLQGLRTEVHDFADLFVKTPGYVHNFKHVHWIDFISCAESNEESKVIINVNNKNYTAVIQITTAFLVDNPSSKGFLVTLHNLRELTSSESERISGDITQREAPLAINEPEQIFSTSSTHIEDAFDKPFKTAEVVHEATTSAEAVITPDPYEAPLDIMMDEEPTPPIIQETPVVEAPVESLDIHFDEPQEENLDIPLEIDIDDDFKDVLVDDLIKEKTSPSTKIVKESFDNGYIYDPQVASDELGLPLDLIEEFIQDFIEQANEFKEDLYKHLNENNLDDLKILSHKLKGVAANLRIEDALETITVVNTESNINLISQNLDTFYKIISKLSGEEITVEKEVLLEEKEIIEEEIITSNHTDKLLNDAEETEIDLYSDPEIIEEELLLKEDTNLEDETLIEEEFTLSENMDESALEVEDKIQNEAIEIELTDDFKIDDLKIEEETPLNIDYSKEIVANEIGLDIESFNELFEDFIKEAKEISDLIKEALSHEDFNKLHQESLKLQGMSENMRVTSFSQELETLFNSKESQELSDALTTIDKTIELLSNKEG